MSIPYYVHKDDEALYEQYNNESLVLKDKARMLVKKLIAEAKLHGNVDIKIYRTIEDDVSEQMTPEWFKLEDKYKDLRIKHMYDDVDMSQYNTSDFLGRIFISFLILLTLHEVY